MDPVYVRWCGAQPVSGFGEALLRSAPLPSPLPKTDLVPPDLDLEKKKGEAELKRRRLLVYSTLVSAARAIRERSSFRESQLNQARHQAYRTVWPPTTDSDRSGRVLQRPAKPDIADGRLRHGDDRTSYILTVNAVNAVLRRVWGTPGGRPASRRSPAAVSVNRFGGIDDHMLAEHLRGRARAVAALPVVPTPTGRHASPSAPTPATGDRDAPFTRLAVACGLPSDLDTFLGIATPTGPAPATHDPATQQATLALAINLRRHQNTWFEDENVLGKYAPLTGGRLDEGRLLDSPPGLGLRLPFSALQIKDPFRVLVENTHAFEEVVRAVTFRATDCFFFYLSEHQHQEAFLWYVTALACEYEYGETVEDLSPTRVLAPVIRADAGTDTVAGALKQMVTAMHLHDRGRHDQIIRTLIGVEAFGRNERFDATQEKRSEAERAGEQYTAHRSHLAWKRRARLRDIMDHVQALALAR